MEFLQKFLLVAAGLVLFGGLYDHLVGRLEEKRLNRGFTSLLVVVGVGVTVGASALLIGLENALVVLALFVASGLPMIVGSISRYIRERAEEDRRASEMTRQLLEESQDDAETADR